TRPPRSARGKAERRLALIVLAILARGAAELAAELAGEVALIGEATAQGDLGHRGIGVDQGAARDPQAELAQKSLWREVEGGEEPALERAEGHVRQGREVPVRDLVMELGAHVSQRRAEAGCGGFEAASGPGGTGNPGRPDNRAFRISDGNLVGY